MPLMHGRRHRLTDFSFSELLDFELGWQPRTDGRARPDSRWQSWADYLAAYRAVRDAFLADREAWRRPSAGTPFAEWLYQRTRGDAARVAALEAEGDRLTAEERRRYPALVVNGVCALYRSEVGG